MTPQRIAIPSRMGWPSGKAKGSFVRGDFDQVTVRIADIDGADRAARAVLGDRALFDRNAQCLEVVGHGVGRGFRQEAQVRAVRRRGCAR